MISEITKRVPLALSAATATGETTSSEGSIRFPLNYEAEIVRWRIHVRNHNYASGRSFASGGMITGIWIGEGKRGEYRSLPLQISSEIEIPISGADLATPWIEEPLGPGIDYLLSIGWRSPPASKVETAGGAWVSNSREAAPTLRHASYRPAVSVPFDWWIEAEVDSSTPTVAGYGDSITVGTGTERIIHTSWLSQYARIVKALPLHRAFPGSGMTLWMDSANHKWDMWRGFPQSDYVIHAMGQNDLGSATSASFMRERFETTLPLIRSLISQNVYVATITPHANKSSHQNSVRRAHADYLRSLPLGVIGVVDFASVVSDDDIGLRSKFRGGNWGLDELHPGTEGAAMMAALAAQVVNGISLNT